MIIHHLVKKQFVNNKLKKYQLQFNTNLPKILRMKKKKRKKKLNKRKIKKKNIKKK